MSVAFGLLASDVPFRRLHRGVAKQKLHLFEFATTQVAEAGATATKIVWRILPRDDASLSK
jgi:hypothetical protein